MLEKLFLVLATALLSGLSAWWAGRLGVRRALEQKKAELAFGRRLDWYEQATRAVGEHAAALNHLVVGARNRFNEQTMSELMDALIAKQPGLTAVIAEAQMYAMPQSALLLAELSRSTKLLLEPTPKDPSDRAKGFDFDVARVEQAGVLAFNVATMLAAEVRSQIGLESLGPASHH